MRVALALCAYIAASAVLCPIVWLIARCPASPADRVGFAIADGMCRWGNAIDLDAEVGT